MPRLPRPVRLAVAPLEDRTCPAVTTAFSGGTLTVNGTPTGNLLVQRTGVGASTFKVTDGATNLGTYAVTGDLKLALRSYPGTVGIDLNSAGVVGTVPGNVQIDLGLGRTAGTGSVSVYDSQAASGGAAVGRIGGYLRVLNGSGSDTVTVGQDTAVANHPIRVGGNVFATGRVGSGLDSFLLDNGTVVGHDVIVSQYSGVTLGDGGPGTVATVNGNLVATVSAGESGLGVLINGTVVGNLTVSGNGLGDNFTLQQNASAVGGTVGGNLTLALSEAGPLTGNTAFFDVGTTVGGSVSILSGAGGGTGGDLFTLNGNVFGSLNLNMGGGVNTLDFAGTVFGNAAVSGGNGVNYVGAPTINAVAYGAGGSFAGAVNGNVGFAFGNGQNYLDLTAAVSGRVTYQGGNIENNVRFAGQAGYAPVVRVTFGSGTNRFAWATDAFSAATISASPGAANTYDDGGFAFSQPVTLVNFP